MRNETVQLMAISSIIIALIAIMTFVPNVGYITFGTMFSICTIHIIVLIASMLYGWRMGLLAGFAFGLCNLIKAVALPTAVTDIFFIDPRVSLLPRVIFGGISGLIFDYLRRITNIKARTTAFVIASGVCTLFHTVLVLGSLWRFAQDVYSNGFKLIITSVFGINFTVECLLACVLVPTIGKAMGKARKDIDPYKRHNNEYRLTIEPILFVSVGVCLIVTVLISKSVFSLAPIFALMIFTIVKASLRKEKRKDNE